MHLNILIYRFSLLHGRSTKFKNWSLILRRNVIDLGFASDKRVAVKLDIFKYLLLRYKQVVKLIDDSNKDEDDWSQNRDPRIPF